MAVALYHQSTRRAADLVRRLWDRFGGNGWPGVGCTGSSDFGAKLTLKIGKDAGDALIQGD